MFRQNRFYYSAGSARLPTTSAVRHGGGSFHHRSLPEDQWARGCNSPSNSSAIAPAAVDQAGEASSLGGVVLTRPSKWRQCHLFSPVSTQSACPARFFSFCVHLGFAKEQGNLRGTHTVSAGCAVPFRTTFYILEVLSMKYTVKNLGTYSTLIAQLDRVARYNRQGSFRTKERYYKAMRRFCRFLSDTYNLQKLTNISARHFNAYVKQLQGEGQAPSTIKTDLAAIRF